MSSLQSARENRESYLVSQGKLTSRARLQHLSRPSKTRSLNSKQVVGTVTRSVGAKDNWDDDDVRLAREGVDIERSVGSLGEDVETRAEFTVQHGKTIEVPLADLVRVKKSRHPSADFEMIPRFKNVLALDETEFGPVGGHGGNGSDSTGANSSEDDEWEMVDDVTEKKVKKSWAAVLSSKA